MWFVKNPEYYDTIVVPNMFGDIITDLGAMIQEAWASRLAEISTLTLAAPACLNAWAAQHPSIPARM